MRRLHKAVTFLLIVLCIVGAVFSYQFLKKEQQRAAMRQQEINEVSKQLEPINQKRRDWEKQDKAWQTTLAEKQTGRTCVLLSFDNMSRELYDTIFELMDQYGFRGTFAMRNGKMPSWETEKNDEYTSSEMMQEMIDAGWDYALSIGEEVSEENEEETHYTPDFSDEFGDLAAQSEMVSEEESENSDQETSMEETESETEPQGYAAQLDEAVTRLSENGYTQPSTLFCTKEQYEDVTEKELTDLGFTMVSVADTQEHPVIDQKANEEEPSKLWVIDTGVYTQRDDQMEKELDAIIAKQQSVAISINDIVKISRDIDYDLSLTAFTSLLNYLKELEAERKINVLTYSEYYQYEQLRKEAYENALAEYAAFREEMLAALESLDVQEGQIAKQLKETEAPPKEEQE
ncbi:MAG: polysaccharide deacetylase family protein [Lachnospiraceae bacterium]|nr:polysaccharide deacetylase family protein [Lachnospiraceae bacterium]